MQPVMAMEPSHSPVAMSMALLQASTHSNWQATSKSPIMVFSAAWPRAPLELFHSQRSSTLEDMLFVMFFISLASVSTLAQRYKKFIYIKI